MEELITIIVPIYNGEKYLDRCIQSILGQTYKNIEIILINDGSTDGSSKICRKYQKSYNNIVFIDKQNEGVSKTRNVGLKYAKGEYVGFVDSDDFIEKNMYSELYNNMKKCKSDLSICNYSYNNDIELKNIFSSQEALEYLFEKKYFRGFLWNKLYKMSIIKNNSIYLDEDVFICEDLLFNYKYIKKCEKISYLDLKLYNYEINNTSALHSGLDKKYLTIVQAYEKIIKEANNDNLETVENSYFKVLCDLIYRNSILKNKIDITQIIKRRKELYLKIKKHQVKVKDKIALTLYYYFPIIIGNLKKIMKRGKI